MVKVMLHHNNIQAISVYIILFEVFLIFLTSKFKEKIFKNIFQSNFSTLRLSFGNVGRNFSSDRFVVHQL